MNNQPLVAFSLRLVLGLSLLCQTAKAQPPQNPPTPSGEDTRIARLIGLAKVWGTVKYFHPFLAYRDIDWDKALIDAIPKVNAARTAEEYQASINRMLSALGDKNTHADLEIQTKTIANSDPVNAAANAVRIENRVLVINAAQIAKALVQDEGAQNGLMGNIRQALDNVGGVVIDARMTSDEDELQQFDAFLRRVLPAMLDVPIVIGSTRYRQHNGYATQAPGGSDLYSSAFLTSASQTISGRGKTKTPIAFIINENSSSFTDIMSGMQSANRAVVIQEGEQPTESKGGTFTIHLPDNVTVHMRTSEQVYSDGSNSFQADIVLPKQTSDDAALKEAMRVVQENKIDHKPRRTIQTLTSEINPTDKPYEEMGFPTVEYRLLALFRFWNVINFFYPYKNLIGDSWETVLPRFIPKFEANKDVVEYQTTVQELVTEIHDSHGGVRNAKAAHEKLGMFQPAVVTSYIENKSVVTRVLDKNLPIKVGDVVLAVDDQPVEKRKEYLSRYLSASTPQWLMLGVHSTLLTGPKDSVAKLRVSTENGETRDVTLPRAVSILDPKVWGQFDHTSPMIQVLPSGYGYVDLTRLEVSDVDKMFDTIKNTPAVIFDMRGYPNGTAPSIAPRLTEKKDFVGALFSRPLLEATSLNVDYFADGAHYSFSQKLPGVKGDVYKGKVVVLINEEAVSQAEHLCLFFEAAADVTFVGTPTAGANGDITLMVLPGNLVVSFTGHNVRHADGRQLQRVGIQPTIRVAPTIRGIADGRDEILEAAIKYLQQTTRK